MPRGRLKSFRRPLFNMTDRFIFSSTQSQKNGKEQLSATRHTIRKPCFPDIPKENRFPDTAAPVLKSPFPETRPNQKRSSETFQTTFALTSNSLGFKTARAYFLIAVRILSAMWVAPAVRPDIPISDAAASLINSFILSLFLVFVLRML